MQRNAVGARAIGGDAAAALRIVVARREVDNGGTCYAIVWQQAGLRRALRRCAQGYGQCLGPGLVVLVGRAVDGELAATNCAMVPTRCVPASLMLSPNDTTDENVVFGSSPPPHAATRAATATLVKMNLKFFMKVSQKNECSKWMFVRHVLPKRAC